MQDLTPMRMALRKAKRVAKRTAKKTARRGAKLAMVVGSLTGTAAFAEQQSVKLEIYPPNNAAQLAKIHQRVRVAAEQVCDPLESKELNRHAIYVHCVNDAVSSAMAQINLPAKLAPPVAAPVVGDAAAPAGSETLTDVAFRHDSSRLAPDSTAALDEIAATLKQHPQMHAQIQGYADSSRSTIYRRWMSRYRIGAVRRYMVAQGVSPSQLTTVGKGVRVAVTLVPNGSDVEVAALVSPGTSR